MPKAAQLKPLWLILLFLGLIGELGCLTFWKTDIDNYTKPFIWLGAGLLTALAALPLLAFKQNETAQVQTKPRSNLLPIFFVFGLCAAFIGSQLYMIFLDIPVNHDSSDVVPSLQLYVRRLLSGQFPYKPMYFTNWMVYPTYFPLLWLPYIFSELLNIDYRWTAYIAFLLVILVYYRRLLKQQMPAGEAILKAALPFAIIYSIILYSRKVFGFSVELLPAAFYLILCLSVFHRSRWFMAIGILLCLLSRYAFTFWLPLYMIIYWVEKGFKSTFRVSLYVVLGVIFIYVLPFMSQDWGILQKGLGYYDKTARTQWVPQYWQAKDEVPFHLKQGQSFAIYFYEKTELEIADRLSLNRKVHLLACLIAAGLIAAFYFFYRNKGLNTKWYLILALKFYLCIFYGFFYVPFFYLYMLPLFLSLPIFLKVPWAKSLRPSLP